MMLIKAATNGNIQVSCLNRGGGGRYCYSSLWPARLLWIALYSFCCMRLETTYIDLLRRHATPCTRVYGGDKNNQTLSLCLSWFLVSFHDSISRSLISPHVTSSHLTSTPSSSPQPTSPHTKCISPLPSYTSLSSIISILPNLPCNIYK